MKKLKKVGIGIGIVFIAFLTLGIVMSILEPIPEEPKKVVKVEKPKPTPKVEKPKPKVVKSKPKPKVEKKKDPYSITDLKATVRFDGKQFTIINRDTFDWVSCKMEVNSGILASGYILRQRRLKANTTYTVGALQFAKPDGTRLNPFTTKVLNITISCDMPNGKRGWWYGGWE